MKFLLIILTGLFVFLYSYKAKSQDNKVVIELSEEDKIKLQEYDNILKLGENLLMQAEQEEPNFMEYIESKDKDDKEKGEKKALEAKKFRIDALANFHTAAVGICNVYKQKFVTCVFADTADETKVKLFQLKANESNKNAEKKIKRYKAMASSDLKAKKYTSIVKDTKEQETNLRKNIENMEQAFKICQEQKDKAVILKQEALDRQKKANEEKDLWAKATQDQNLESYQLYLEKYPDGKFANFAREMIMEIERKNLSSTADIFYKVVISAKNGKFIPGKELGRLCPLYPTSQKTIEGYPAHLVDKSFPNKDAGESFIKTLKISELDKIKYIVKVIKLDSSGNILKME